MAVEVINTGGSGSGGGGGGNVVLGVILGAVLLAAGRGTRMRELTNDLPKPMIQVRGKPILLHIVEGLKAAGFNVVSQANNHTYDWGPEALLDSLERLRAAGIQGIRNGRTELAGERCNGFFDVDVPADLLEEIIANSRLPSKIKDQLLRQSRTC